MVEEAYVSGNGGETGGNDPFEDFRAGLKQNNDAE